MCIHIYIYTHICSSINVLRYIIIITITIIFTFAGTPLVLTPFVRSITLLLLFYHYYYITVIMSLPLFCHYYYRYYHCYYYYYCHYYYYICPIRTRSSYVYYQHHYYMCIHYLYNYMYTRSSIIICIITINIIITFASPRRPR